MYVGALALPMMEGIVCIREGATAIPRPLCSVLCFYRIKYNMRSVYIGFNTAF